MPDPADPTIVRVELDTRSYDIVIGDNLLSGIAGRLKQIGVRDRVFVLSDETVWRLHGGALEAGLLAGGIRAHVIQVPSGEQAKSWTQLGAVLGQLLDEGAARDDTLLAFGGGVVGDLAGLAAALMKRGMALVQVPTTVLAQVDSSVGGKTAVNTAHGKNLIGAFYQPKLVLADTALLQTLPARECRAGYAEIIKYGFINDPEFLDWLSVNGSAVLQQTPAALAYAVAVSCRAKAQIVAQDEREGGVRALLNFGHTFGHTLEAATGYGDRLLHGEAVATGMALALRYSARLGLISLQDAEKGCQMIAASGLQSNIADLPCGPYVAGDLAKAMTQDKKARQQKVPLILAKGLGQSFIYPDADLDDVAVFLEQELNKS